MGGGKNAERVDGVYQGVSSSKGVSEQQGGYWAGDMDVWSIADGVERMLLSILGWRANRVPSLYIPHEFTILVRLCSR